MDEIPSIWKKPLSLLLKNQELHDFVAYPGVKN